MSTDGLKRASVRGAALTIAGQIASLVLRFGSTAVLARLLTPEDFGLVAMSAVATGLVGMFRDAGLSNATIQRPQISDGEVSNLFWINAGVGFALFVIVLAASPALAWFYREPRLMPIVCALSVSFLFSGFCLQHIALLRRRMRFRALAGLDFIATALGIVVAIVGAFSGLRYWALVLMVVVAAVVQAAGAWILMRWKPSLPSRKHPVWAYLSFGGNILAYDIMSFLSRQMDILVLGVAWGARPVGLYEKSYNLLMLPVSQASGPIGSVAIPALCRLQSEPARFMRFFLNIVELIATVVVPPILLLSIFSREVVLIFLGASWLEAALLFQLLSPAAIVLGVTTPWTWLLISRGETRKLKVIGLCNATTIIAAVLLALPFGAKGVAAALSTALVALLFSIWFYATKGSPLRVSDILLRFAPVFAAALPASLAAFVFRRTFAMELVAWQSVVLGGIIFALFYGITLLFVFRKLHFYKSLLVELKPRNLTDTSGDRSTSG